MRSITAPPAVPRAFSLMVMALTFMAILTPATARAGETMDIEGGGWGHGIGMSQYGAYGQALEGKTAEEIVAHYYSGSSTASLSNQVGSGNWVVTDPTPLWVGLLTHRTVFEFAAVDGSLSVCHSGSGGCAYTAEPGDTWRFVTVAGGKCRLQKNGSYVSPAGPCRGGIIGMSPTGGKVELTDVEAGRNVFARGAVRIRKPAGADSFHIALEIGLEQYMYGLAEVPFYWHQEALQAQALAGRSYASWRLISRGPEADFSDDRKATCWCHMYATTADQAYKGWANEAAAGSDAWKAAVDGTAGKVITHPDASQANVVAAFYSSSTGGRTENVEDMWGGSAVSYLRSRPDPWSQSPAVANPFGAWSYSFTEDQLANSYGVDKVDGITVRQRFASGTPSQVRIFTRTDGEKGAIDTSGTEMYTQLGLRGRNVSGFDYGDIAVAGGAFSGGANEGVLMFVPFNNSAWVGKAKGDHFVMSRRLNMGREDDLHNLVAGDFNGDGRQDFAAIQGDTGRLVVGVAKPRRFKISVWARHANAAPWQTLVSGDFDGDGRDDLAEYDSARERWRVYRLSGSEVVKEIWYDFTVTDPQWTTHLTGDMNGDGTDDIISIDGASGDVIALLSSGSGFTPTTWQQLPTATGWTELFVADFTGSGRADLAAFSGDTSTWWVMRGRKTGTGTEPAPWVTIPGSVDHHAVGDFTGDGKTDLVAVHDSGAMRVLASSGSGFTHSVWGNVPAAAEIAAVVAIDVNGDGNTDAAAWDNAKRRWWVAESNGSGFAVSTWGRLLR